MVASSTVGIPVLLAPRTPESGPSDKYEYLVHAAHPSPGAVTVEDVEVFVKRAVESKGQHISPLLQEEPFDVSIWEVRRELWDFLRLHSRGFLQLEAPIPSQGRTWAAMNEAYKVVNLEYLRQHAL